MPLVSSAATASTAALVADVYDYLILASSASSSSTGAVGLITDYALQTFSASAPASTSTVVLRDRYALTLDSSTADGSTSTALLRTAVRLTLSSSAAASLTSAVVVKAGTGDALASLHRGFTHTFKFGSTTRTLPAFSGGRITSPVDQFQAEMDVSGGFLSAAASITAAELAANSTVFQLGSTWTVTDNDTGQVVFAGMLKDPSVSGGVATLSATGWGEQQEQNVGRFLALSYNLDSWVGFDSPDFDLDAVQNSGDSGLLLLQPGGVASAVYSGGVPGTNIGTSIIQAERKGPVLSWRVGSDTGGATFADPGKNGATPATYNKTTDTWSNQKYQWANGFMMWTPDAKVKHIAFRLIVTRPSKRYAMDLVGLAFTRDASGNVVAGAGGVPQGNLVKITSWNLGPISAGGVIDSDSAVDIAYTLPNAAYDIIGLRLRRLVPSLKKVQQFQARAYRVRYGAVSNSAADADAMKMDGAYRALFGMMGTYQNTVDASTEVVTPFDQSGTYGSIADSLSLVDNWYWRIDADALGRKIGKAGSVDSSTVWDLSDKHSPVDLTPETRYNRVRYNYNYGNGQEGFDYVTATTVASWGPGVDITYDLTLQDPAPRVFMQKFAQQVADYLALPRSSGRVTMSTVTRSGVETRATAVRPGDRIRLTNYGNLTMTVTRLTLSNDGTVDAELATGSPMLQRWLKRRDRFLAMGLDGLGAMLSLLGADNPKAPYPVNLAFDPIESTTKLDYDAVVTWAPVLEDTSTPAIPTAIDSYIVRIHPTNLSGQPISQANGGGWRERTVISPTEDDMRVFLTTDQNVINTQIGTSCRFQRIPNPKKWKWVTQVRAVDVLGQMSDWSSLDVDQYNKPGPTLPTAYGPKRVDPTSLELSTDSRKITLTWDSPLRTDDEANRDRTGVSADESGIDEDSYFGRLSPGIAYYNVRLYRATSPSGTNATLIGSEDRPAGREAFTADSQYTWTVGTNWKDYWWNGWVQTVDLYGNVAAWSKSGWKRGTLPKPNAPGNVSLAFRLREDNGKMVYSGLVKWDEVSNVPVASYIVHMQACTSSGAAVDGAGSEIDHTVTTAAETHAVNDVAVNSTRSQATYTTTQAHGLSVGDAVTARGFSTGYNGTFKIAAVPTSLKVRRDFTSANIPASNPTDETGSLVEMDGQMSWLSGALPRPDTWFWKVRVRAKAENGTLGPWSAYTTPKKPSTSSDAVTQSKPPAPKNLLLRFVRPGTTGPYTAVIRFDEVSYVPTGGDAEVAMDSYAVELQVAYQYGTGGTKAGQSIPSTAWRSLDIQWFPAKDEDANTVKVCKFPNACRRIHKYRVRAKAKDKSGRIGPWSAFTGAGGA